MLALRPLPRLLPVLLTLAALAAGGCEPRHHVPSTAAPLLNPEREAPQYRRLVLENGIQVMLIADPRADRAAASMSVGVGSLDDPDDRPGLAHFLEHMLFLGTAKYPDAGAYQSFLTRHAGFANAYTADDHTNFHFEVATEAFPDALDRFAQFFIAPTLDETYAQREMNAVDSEHAKNVENDFWRTRQIQRTVYRAGHPISHFSTGNRETLKGVGRAELTAFYRGQYSANRMTLALVGNLGLDDLERLAREKFSPVENRKLPPHRYPTTYLERTGALRLLRVEPVADIRTLELEFPLPATLPYYRAKPTALISSVLGNEGPGSLLSLLKADDLATSIAVGEGDSTHDYASLQVTVGLTPAGLRRYPDVLAQVLGALRKLREEGIPRHAFEEARAMSELAFRFREPVDSMRLATAMSALMQDLPLAELPRAAIVFQDYRPALYRALLERLTPDNLLVTLIAKGLPTDRTERFYSAHYAYREEPGEPYTRLVQARADPRWHLPAPNPFIPRETALYAPAGALRLSDSSLDYLAADNVPGAVIAKLLPDLDVTFTSGEALMARMEGVLTPEERERYLPLLLKDALALPTRLLATPLAKVWYLPDWRFRQPKADLVLKFFAAGAYGSPREAMLNLLYEASLDEDLNEWGYPVREAGLNFSIQAAKSGVVLSLGGYSPRLLELLNRLVPRLASIGLSAERFASVKERMRRGLLNQRVGQPYEQSRYYREQLLEEPAFSREALLEALTPLTLADVKDYAARLYRRAYVQGVVVGNLPPSAARAAIAGALATLGSQPLPPAQRVEEQVRSLPRRADYVFTERLDVNNSLVSALYQAGRTNPRLRGALLIIARKLQDAFYQDARTRQQLGYIVFAGMGQVKKTLSLFFLIQSGDYAADVLQDRTEAFIPRFIADFRALPDEAFENYRRAVIQAKLERDHNLGETAQHLFWSAFENDAEWDFLSTDIRAVEALTRQDVERVLTTVLAGEGRSRLVIRLVGKDHPARAPKGQVISLPTPLRAAARQAPPNAAVPAQ
jgi:insulysin